MSTPLTDPTEAARTWLAAHPDHEVAVHVRAALESADRHETLSRTLEAAKPGETRAVVMSVRGEGNVVFCTTDANAEQRIAEFFVRYHRLLSGTALDREIDRLSDRIAQLRRERRRMRNHEVTEKETA